MPLESGHHAREEPWPELCISIGNRTRREKAHALGCALSDLSPSQNVSDVGCKLAEKGKRQDGMLSTDDRRQIDGR